MGGVTLSYICPHCNSFPLEDYIWWVSTGYGDNRKKKHCRWWCAVCGGKYEWRAPNRILGVQLGTDANEAKVFRAHAAAPQGFCENLINALKLLANQQTDGDSPIQSIVTGLQERSRKGIMDGLRSFFVMDNHSALDVGHLRKGLRPFQAQKPKFSGDSPEASREGADDLTLRAEEVNTLKACITKENRWEPPLVDADWHAFCQANYKGIGGSGWEIEGSEWEELYFSLQMDE